ncbi:hypothetical protein, partial [Chitinimonas sp.]|uniref:hypothetical protein n=1 Tax=Chitinimonas sp. TaxID=1934313 RepID=UPI0035AD8CD2
MTMRQSIAVGAPLQWWAQGWRLWWRAPLRLLLLTIAAVVVEAVLQLGVPLFGMILSKLLVPMVLAGVLLGLQQLDHAGKLPWRSLFWGFSRPMLPRTLAVSTVLLSTVCVQLGVATLVYGPAV